MKDFDPNNKLCIHIHLLFLVSLSFASSPVLLRRIKRACRCQPYLSSCCMTRPHRGVGVCASIHACACIQTLPCQSCTRRAINPPTKTTATPKSAPAIAQQRQRQRQRLPIARRCHGRMRRGHLCHLCYHTMRPVAHLFHTPTRSRICQQ